MSERNKNNEVMVIGDLAADFVFSHKSNGEGFYKSELEIARNSGTVDSVPIVVSERLVDNSAGWKGERTQIYGEHRSLHKLIDGRNRHLLFVFAKEIMKCGFRHENEVYLDGYISKPPVYRKTPLGREIADIMLAVNRAYGKADYIPCVAWGRDAKYAGRLDVGARLQIAGRTQSRKYIKWLPDGRHEARMAYEVSIFRMEEITDGQEES